MKPPLTPLTASTAPASTASVAPLNPAAAVAALPLLFDTHCHCLAPDEASTVRSLCVVSTSEDDWLATEASGTARRSRRVDCRVAYGVHPWWAAGVQPNWEQRLRSRLLASPSALVGEVPIVILTHSHTYNGPAHGATVLYMTMLASASALVGDESKSGPRTSLRSPREPALHARPASRLELAPPRALHCVSLLCAVSAAFLSSAALCAW